MNENCTHKQVTFVGTLGKGCKLYGGGLYQARAVLHTFDLIISLLGYDPVDSSVDVRMNRGAAIALPSLGPWIDNVPDHRCLSIDWPDRNVPELSLKFWKALLKDLTQFNGKVLIHCMGGHGRTGTALSILCQLGGVCGDKDPVAWLRQHYCREAVESASQIQYLNGLGVKTKMKGADDLRPKPVQAGFSYGGWDGRDWYGKGAPTFEGLLTDEELEAGESTGDEQEDAVDIVKRQEREERLRRQAGIVYKSRASDPPRKTFLLKGGKPVRNEFINDGSDQPWLNKR